MHIPRSILYTCLLALSVMCTIPIISNNYNHVVFIDNLANYQGKNSARESENEGMEQSTGFHACTFFFHRQSSEPIPCKNAFNQGNQHFISYASGSPTLLVVDRQQRNDQQIRSTSASLKTRQVQKDHGIGVSIIAGRSLGKCRLYVCYIFKSSIPAYELPGIYMLKL